MKALFPVFFLLISFCNCSQNAMGKEKVFTDLNVEQFKAKMQEQDAVILDVRTPKETAEGMIEGAIEIDIKSDSFAEKIAALEKDKTYLVYCRSGKRSVSACNQMAKLEFDSLYNLLGGYNAWKKAEE